MTYIYSWDSIAQTLTQQAVVDLPGMSYGFGIALDDTRDILWVSDTGNRMVRAYNVNVVADWNDIVEIPTLSFAVSHPVVDVAVDMSRNLVYSVAGWTGSSLLSKYDVVSGTATTVDLGIGGIGVAVEEISGYVYITRGTSAGDDVQVWDVSATPTLVYDTDRIGNPAGLAIANVSYNPLNLAKNGIIQGKGIYIGSTFTYEITFDSPSFDLTNVEITDNVPVELDFVSATEGGVYDPATHTVVWDLGDISAGESVPTIYLVVKVNQNAVPGETIFNKCTINGDQIPPTTIIDDEDDEPGEPVLPNIPVALDIKPASCPNPINAKSKGVLPVAILGTGDHDVNQIDPASVALEGIAPLRWAKEDVATLYEPFLGKEACDECTEEGSDGYMDLTLKFSSQAVVEALGDVEDGDCLILTITGNLKEEFGGTPIIGEDVVLLIEK